MTIDEKLTAIRDVVQFDIGDRGLARDPQRNLINAFPDDFANACRSIAEHPNPSVAIVTGFYIISADPPCGETDGPLGAVFLARAFQSMGAHVHIVTDFFCKKAIEEGLQSAGLGREYRWEDLPPGLSEEEIRRKHWPKVWVRTIPPRTHTWDTFLKLDWAGSIQGNKLTHVIAVERVGPAEDGRCYTMRARDITDYMCPAHRLIDYSAEHFSAVITIGIGDGGNEIGMGKIPVETIARNIENGEKIACRVATDHLIVAGISNWGAYALAAGVALVRGQRLDRSLFDVERERRLLELMVEHGPLVDGKTGERTATVDGVGFEEYIRPLLRIREIVES